MSNEYTVDLTRVRDSSTRTVNSGSARHSERTRSSMSPGSQPALSLDCPDAPRGTLPRRVHGLTPIFPLAPNVEISSHLAL
jgi:hypothetical protein